MLAALVGAMPAAAELQPVRRGDLPLVRPGTVELPAGHATGRIRVVVQLAEAPLARWGRALTATSGRQKLQVGSRASRSYLARLARAQAAAAAQLRRAIPAAKIQRRYRIVLNGFAVDLPARDLPELVRLGFVRKVSPSVRFTLATNESPEIIGADATWALGTRGEGLKIAVVDDGVDPGNAFFDPDGFTFPEGFPRGGRRWTSAKVIVARSFPGPSSGRRGALAVDPQASFHGTHVAGIAAGVAGTQAPAGQDHPPVAGLSGVAPRAWIGNYRVFTVPSPVGNIAMTPEIIAAFEAAAADGMDVVNFSGGGAQTEPANDALVDAVANLAAAGIVPVISAGNDRDDFGLGSAGAPGTAPDAISVAAVSNTQVFAQALRVSGSGDAIAFRPALAAEIPAAWANAGQPLVDVGTITGTDGKPVDRALCGPPSAPNGGPSTLPPGSLTGAIALASRGSCTFVSKALRAKAAGAIGLVLVDNRFGEANGIPVRLAIPGGMIADLDGRRLRDQLAATGGRSTVSIGNRPERIETGRGGVVTSFSSAGPTAFGHLLKPDVAAPGGQILSSTLRIAGGPFAVFDGTSMSAPHVSGAAALLLERHPFWTPQQVKSALVTTAGTAWQDTARNIDASVLLAGAGVVDLPAADDPRIFTTPVSYSFGDLRTGAARALSVRLVDEGGGAGIWQVNVKVQAATAGASLEVPAMVSIAPGGDLFLTAVARAGTEEGENYGMLLLSKGDVTRKVPYLFLVTDPGLERVPVTPLATFQQGDTRRGESRVDAYRYPSWAFGPPPAYGADQPAPQAGAERLYSVTIEQPVANFGVSVIASSSGSVIDPWVLGSRDESDVEGYAGTPVNVNSLTFGYRADIGAAGAALPTPGTYYVSVDSGLDPFTGRSLAGEYLLQAWVNDVMPPIILPVTRLVSAGRPTLVARVVDGLFRPESGVDPLSLAIGYRGVLVGAAAYDPVSGLAVFPLPRAAPKLRVGRLRTQVVASDYQEAKNTASVSESVLPNTSAEEIPIRVVNGPTVAWLRPEQRGCLERNQVLLVVASSTAQIRSVRFTLDGRRVGVDRKGDVGLFRVTARTAGLDKGRHRLRAEVVDRLGRTAVAERVARRC